MLSVNDSAFPDINLNFKFPRCGTFARARNHGRDAQPNLRTGPELVPDLTPISIRSVILVYRKNRHWP